MNAGGPQYVDSSGNVWSADTGYSGGTAFSTTSAISGTSAPTLYQTERYGSGSLTYTFSVPNGTYAVTLKFAEIFFTDAGQRIFNVTLNGKQVLTNFDIVAKAGGPNIALDQQFTTTVTNGQIVILLSASVNNPKVNAIQIVPGTSFAPIRVVAGATTSYADPQGNIWSADTGYSSGSKVTTTSTPINNTTADFLYQHARWQVGGFQYAFTVPNGTHTVTLKFAEIYFTQAGQRQFDIVINGKTVLSNLDIIARAGAANTALDLSFSVNVTGGTVTIEFDPGAANNPQVNAIQIQ